MGYNELGSESVARKLARYNRSPVQPSPRLKNRALTASPDPVDKKRMIEAK